MDKDTLLSCDTAFTARALVQLYINIMLRHNDPFDPNPLTFDDVLTTTKCMRSGMSLALDLLTTRPQCKAQLDNFDIVLTAWVHLVHILLQLATTEDHFR
jgi:hypothetical protein